MNRTYAECLALAERTWGETWYKRCQIVWTHRARTRATWIVRAINPAMFALRRVS